MSQAPKNLRVFLDQLRRDGDLVIVNHPVDPHLELAEIHRRVIAGGGPALLFQNVKGSEFPVATNLFGTKKRVDMAFGSRPEALIRDIVHLAHHMMPPRFSAVLDGMRLAPELLRIGVKRQRSGPILRHRMPTPDLNRLPFTTSWPEDGGGFLTLPLVYTQDPVHKKPNLGIYRMQRHDGTRAGLHWQIGKGGGYHYHRAEGAGEPLPVTVFLGGPPAAILAAIAPMPEDVPELLLASLLLGKRLPVAVDDELPHPLLAGAEFAMVGEALPRERHPEGPFGDHYGYYSLKHDYPVFHCRRLYHRDGAVFPATVVGKPKQEDFFLGDYLQELLSPIFPMVMPSVLDIWAYGETGYHSLAGAVVKDRYPREAMVSAFRILGEGQLSLTKFLMMTDARVNLKDFRAFLTHILARVNFETDLYVFSALSMDTLDYTGPEVNKGSKGVLVGLGGPVRDLPKVFDGELPRGFSGARVFCPGCLVIEGPRHKDEPEAASRLARAESLADWPMVVVVDDAPRATASVTNFLWTTFTRFEPAADIFARDTRVHRHHLVYSAPIVIDARMKPWYPAELFVDDDTRAKVDQNWKKYFPGRAIEMGSSDHGHLAPTR